MRILCSQFRPHCVSHFRQAKFVPSPPIEPACAKRDGFFELQNVTFMRFMYSASVATGVTVAEIFEPGGWTQVLFTSPRLRAALTKLNNANKTVKIVKKKLDETENCDLTRVPHAELFEHKRQKNRSTISQCSKSPS